MVDIKETKKELLNLIRNSDFISKINRGVTTDSQTFDGNNSTKTFPLTQIGIRNIRSVEISSVPQTFGTDWDFAENETTKITTVTFTIAPPTGTDNVEITYDYGPITDIDRICDDFAQGIVSNSKFPRIGFDVISEATDPRSVTQNPLLQNRIVFVMRGYGIGKNQAETLSNQLNNLFKFNKNLFNLTFLRKNGRSQMQPFEGTNNKIFFRENLYLAPFEFER